MAHTVQIGDYDGNAFKIRVNMDLVGSDGTWLTLDYGYIRYSSGVAWRIKYDHDLTSGGLQLLGPNGKYGIQLDDWAPRWIAAGHLPNDRGDGNALQPWVLKLKPGKITWALVD